VAERTLTLLLAVPDVDDVSWDAFEIRTAALTQKR